MNDEMAWRFEERLWLDGVSAYEEILDPACLMAFPGIGVMGYAAVLEGLVGAERWTTVNMTERTVNRAGNHVVVLGYTAEGQREGAQLYRCFCTSTYGAVGEDWKMVQHQQTLAN